MMPNNFVPKFELRTYCKNCDQLIHMKNPLDHECPKDPAVMKKASQNVARENAKYKTEEVENERVTELWNKWVIKQGLQNIGCPAVDHGPNDRAHKGRCIIFSAGWARRGLFYRTAIMTNPTWGRVFRHFQESMRQTEDHHHAFLKGLHKPRKKDRPIQLRDVPEDVTVLEFSTGS